MLLQYETQNACSYIQIGLLVVNIEMGNQDHCWVGPILFPIFNKFFRFVLGEVERLLREYRQNQELVRNIGAHYYQIIYPVQLRHHEKMGISTREVNTQKVSLILHIL